MDELLLKAISYMEAADPMRLTRSHGFWASLVRYGGIAGGVVRWSQKNAALNVVMCPPGMT